MYFIAFLNSLIRSLLRFARTCVALFWRVINHRRLRYIRQINMESDECEFDSTWEEECENKAPRKKVCLGTTLYLFIFPPFIH